MNNEYFQSIFEPLSIILDYFKIFVCVSSCLGLSLKIIYYLVILIFRNNCSVSYLGRFLGFGFNLYVVQSCKIFSSWNFFSYLWKYVVFDISWGIISKHIAHRNHCTLNTISQGVFPTAATHNWWNGKPWRIPQLFLRSSKHHWYVQLRTFLLLNIYENTLLWLAGPCFNNRNWNVFNTETLFLLCFSVTNFLDQGN